MGVKDKSVLTVGTGLASAVLLAAAPGGASAQTGGTPEPRDSDVFFGFDARGGDGTLALRNDGSAAVTASISAVAPGLLSRVPDRDGGWALRTEGFRPGAPAQPAVVVVRADDPDADVTAPRWRDFGFGASFTLDAVSEGSEDDNGNNLVQRGLSRDVSQYKLQVDDRQPLCRVAGSAGAVTVRAAARVQPDAWYRVKCRRSGEEVQLRLVTLTDAGRTVEEWTARGETGSVSWPAGAQPLSIGGKVGEDGTVLAGSSDQFNGRIDDVFMRLLD